MDENYLSAQPLQLQWWQQAEMDTQMAVGEQNYMNSMYNVNYRNQRQLQFPKIPRVINMVGGYQRKNRHVMLCDPVENSDAETADQLNAALFHATSQDNTYEKISQCFDGSNTVGLNMLKCYMDYREDPENGSICTSRIPYNAFVMDPYWKDATLSDCDWVWERHYFSAKQIIALYPKLKKDLPSMQRQQSIQDGRFMYMPENRQMYDNNLYAYDEYWTRDYKTTKKLLDIKTGEVVDMPTMLEGEKLDLFMRFNPNIKIIKAQKPTVKLHVLVNNNLVHEEEAPYGIDRYPYVPFLCYFTPEIQDYSYRYQGIVRNIRDSQVELNRRRNRMLDILDSQINSGIIVKEDALVDPEDAYLSGQGRALFLKDSATLADIHTISPPQIPPSMFELQKIMDDEIMNIAGINEELFGQSDDPTISGFLTQLRMGAGLVSLQSIFDRLNQSQKLVGKIFIELIQANFGVGKMRRILNKDPTEQFKDQMFQKYDCVVEEGILTSTQRQMQFVQLLQLRQMGIPVPTNLLLEASTLQNKKELIEAISQEEQQQAKMAQAQQLLEVQQQSIINRNYEAQAQNNFAMAEERKARAVSNIGLAKERQAQSIQDRSTAALNNAKAMKELSEMDESRLMNLVNFVLDIQDRQKTIGDTEIQESQAEAEDVGSEVQEADTETENTVKSTMQQVEEAI
jgi:hypothetical protein